MIHCPIWAFLLLLVLSAAESFLITILIQRKRKTKRWILEIDRLSKYWLEKVEDNIKNNPSLERPDEIIIKLNK